MKPHVCALVGAQYGSEGKGTIAYELAHDYNIHVRTGAPNAGHTIRHGGVTFKMRSIPCGWVNPNAYVVIGAGALIDVELLIREIQEIELHGYEIRSRLLIDSKAQILLREYHEMEGGTEGEAHRRIGSTGEGVGPARMAKIARGTVSSFPFNEYESAATSAAFLGQGLQVTNTAAFLNRRRRGGATILLEGTQGCGLSLTHGDWPYCTSTDTNAAQLCADAGIPPTAIERVILVARTYPIRVAGNSGPLQDEITWSELGVPEERTTVTLKTRRVGLWDDDLMLKACMLNDPTEIALTFLDYIDPEVAGVQTWGELTDATRRFIYDVEDLTGVDVTMAGVGGIDFTVLRSPSPQSFRISGRTVGDWEAAHGSVADDS